MLPGLRSLFIAVVLSVSMLVFGLGAAALLRATHEEFASLPLQRIPEVVFATRENAAPTLAMLQVDPPPADISPTDTPPTALDRHDAPPQVVDAAATHEAPAAIAPVAPEATSASDPGTAATDTVAAPAVQPQIDDKPAIGVTPPTEEKIAATPSPDGNSADPTAAAPSTPAMPEPDAAIADESAATPATDPVRNPADEAQASATQTVAALDPATPVSAAPESTGQPSMDAVPASTASGDSKPDEARPDEARSDEIKSGKSGDIRPDDARTEDATPEHADRSTAGAVPETAEPSPAHSTAIAALEDGRNETTGRVTSKPPVSVETKAAIPDIAPQTVPADAANRPPRNDAPVITALNIHIPMPVARPKILGKASLTVKPVTRKHVSRQRPAVHRARVVRPTQPKPADPFAGTPFGSN